MRWASLSEGARERSQAYGRDRFNRELHILLAELF
jgi:hypothetical protein